jgi:hypothetical protein
VLGHGNEDVATTKPFVMDKIPGIIKNLKTIDGAPTPRFRKFVVHLEAMLPIKTGE